MSELATPRPRGLLDGARETRESTLSPDLSRRDPKHSGTASLGEAPDRTEHEPKGRDPGRSLGPKGS